MDAFGFREALPTALDVLLPHQLGVKVISLPALAMLKLVAWEDRHLTYTAKGRTRFSAHHKQLSSMR
jgi:predicted nucleotidyltransferase